MLLKTVFVFMSVMYLLSPLQTELYSFFHEISHQLESKFNSTESHQHHTQNAINHHHDHDFSTLEVTAKSEHHHDDGIETSHSHQILSFLNAVFNTDESTNNSDKLLVETKLDKHIIPLTVINPEELPSITTLKIWFYTLKIDQMGFDVNTPPPKTYFI